MDDTDTMQKYKFQAVQACIAQKKIQTTLSNVDEPHLLHGLRVAHTDVQLHLVHVVRLAVDLVPPLETLRSGV